MVKRARDDAAARVETLKEVRPPSKPNHKKLTKESVTALKPKAKGYYINDTVVTGLALYVGTSGRKSWYFCYKSRDGKKQRYRIGDSSNYSAAAAKDEARKLRVALADGNDPSKKKRKGKKQAAKAKARTLRLYLEGTYKAHHLDQQKSGDHTGKRIAAAYAPFLDRDMASITATELTTQRTKRLKLGRKPATLNRDRLAVHSLFEQAIKDGMIDHNPAAKHGHPPLKLVDDQRVRYLGQMDEHEHHKQGELKRFMAALDDSPLPFRTMVILAMNTGMRRGELFSLTWDRVSLKNRTVTLDPTTTTKTSTKRTTPLNDKAMTALKAWKAAQTVVDIRNTDKLVFPSPVTGQRLVNIKNPWTALLHAAEIEDFRFHDVRHHYASQLVQAGVDLNTVRELLGHCDIAMTLRYSHLSQDHLADAVAKI